MIDMELLRTTTTSGMWSPSLKKENQRQRESVGGLFN